MRSATPVFRMADRLAEGNLSAFLLAKDGEGWSFDQIARELYARFGIEVTRQTVENWLIRLHAESQAEAG